MLMVVIRLLMGGGGGGGGGKGLHISVEGTFVMLAIVGETSPMRPPESRVWSTTARPTAILIALWSICGRL